MNNARLARTATLLAIGSVFLLFGCSRTQESPDRNEPQIESASKEETVSSGAGWYYFSSAGIHAAPDPSAIPAASFSAWTEAIRVSDVAIIDGVPTMLINRLGLMESPTGGTAPALRTDPRFAGKTAAGLYDIGQGYAIRLYRNSFFSAQAGEIDATCLMAFDAANASFAPVFSSENFGLSPEAQCVALDRVGSMWYASFKLESAGKVDFTYLEFANFPDAARGESASISSRKISVDVYQKSVAPFAWTDAPQNVQGLLSAIPPTTPFGLTLHTAGLPAPRHYTRAGDGTTLEATAWQTDNSVSVLFSDGTFIWKLAAQDSPTRTIKLPPLSAGYAYTAYVISGNFLLASWEEQRFYETGRAGLLVTPLPDGLY